MLSVEVFSEAEGSGLAQLLSSTGWHLAVDGTIRLWKDCHRPGFVSGAGPQGSGVDQSHQPGTTQSAW